METYLAHHGILGMKWGVRRYQNEDGTLTAAGKKRYGKADSSKYGKLGRNNAIRTVAAGTLSTVASSAANHRAVNVKFDSDLKIRDAIRKADSAQRRISNQIYNDEKLASDSLAKMRDLAESGQKLRLDANPDGTFRWPYAEALGERQRALARAKVRADDYAAITKSTNETVSQYAAVARAATSVAGIVSGVGAVTTIGFGAIAAGQLAYSAYLKHQAKKVQNKEA